MAPLFQMQLLPPVRWEDFEDLCCPLFHEIWQDPVVPCGTRQEIHDLVEEGVRKLGSAHGGPTLVCGIYPPTPPENVDAVCCAFEKLRTYWWE